MHDKRTRRVNCNDCYWTAEIDEADESFGLHTVHHLYKRLDPGGVVPAGKCPECGALAYLDNDLHDKLKRLVKACENALDPDTNWVDAMTNLRKALDMAR